MDQHAGLHCERQQGIAARFPIRQVPRTLISKRCVDMASNGPRTQMEFFKHGRYLRSKLRCPTTSTVLKSMCCQSPINLLFISMILCAENIFFAATYYKICSAEHLL